MFILHIVFKKFGIEQASLINNKLLKLLTNAVKFHLLKCFEFILGPPTLQIYINRLQYICITLRLLIKRLTPY